MKIASIDAVHVIGTGRQLLVCIWRRETTMAAISKLKATVGQLVAGSRDGIVMVTVVESNAEMPESNVRAELANIFRMASQSVICSALVFEGEGFRAAAVRGVTTAINMMAKQPFPHKVFATVVDASNWVTQESDGRVKNVAESVVELRSALNANGELRVGL